MRPRNGHFKLSCTMPGCEWANWVVVTNPRVTTDSDRWDEWLGRHGHDAHDGADEVTGLITDQDNPVDTQPLVVSLTDG